MRPVLPADGNLAVITPQGVQLTDFDGRPIVRQVQHVTWDPIMAEKGGFKLQLRCGPAGTGHLNGETVIVTEDRLRSCSKGSTMFN